MSRTCPELKTEIARLSAEAERAEAYELPTVIAEVNVLIERYQLTGAMIFGTTRMERSGTTRTVIIPKHVDQIAGSIWTGRGPKPTWLAEALSAGTLAENLLVT